MMKIVPVKAFERTDLAIQQCGMEFCSPNHDYGPAVRDHFLIHYVKSGKGIFQVGSKTYTLYSGQGFLITPNVLTYYKADSEQPWHYYWIGFSGSKAAGYLAQAGLDTYNPIFEYSKDEHVCNCFEEMIKTCDIPSGREIRLLGLLHIFLSLLMENNDNNNLSKTNFADRKESYVRSAIDYIETNYYRYISISSMSKTIGLDRSYLGSIFRDLIGMSPQKYLLSFRINKAVELMDNPLLSISDIARSVGYKDPLLFCKMFKKAMGCSPTQFRKNKQNHNL